MADTTFGRSFNGQLVVVMISFIRVLSSPRVTTHDTIRMGPPKAHLPKKTGTSLATLSQPIHSSAEQILTIMHQGYHNLCDIQDP
jgi:hypothetical protein